jgi:hypothetical protein
MRVTSFSDVSGRNGLSETEISEMANEILIKIKVFVEKYLNLDLK